MRVQSKTNAAFVEYPPGSGEVYEPGVDGVYDLPEPVARELTSKHAGHWALESVQQATASRQRAAKLRSPQQAADAISRHDSEIAQLNARVEELEQRLDAALGTDYATPEAEAGESSETDGALEDGGGQDGDGEGAPAAPTAKRAASSRGRSPKGT